MGQRAFQVSAQRTSRCKPGQSRPCGDRKSGSWNFYSVEVSNPPVHVGSRASHPHPPRMLFGRRSSILRLKLAGGHAGAVLRVPWRHKCMLRRRLEVESKLWRITSNLCGTSCWAEARRADPTLARGSGATFPAANFVGPQDIPRPHLPFSIGPSFGPLKGKRRSGGRMVGIL